MFRYLINKIKNHSFSLRFSILSIFVVFSLLLIVIEREVIHALFMQSMNKVSFKLMQEVSNLAYQQISQQMQKAEAKNKATAELLKDGIIKIKNHELLNTYAQSVMHNEEQQSPKVNAVYWGDESGSLVKSQKEDNGTSTYEMIDRSVTPPTHNYIYYNLQGNISGRASSTDFSFDPRNRPWYLAAKTNKKTSWIDVYKYLPQGYFGVSVATPVFDDNNQLLGVVGFDIKLEYIRELINDANQDAAGKIFIVNSLGSVIAFPGMTPNDYAPLKNIRDMHDNQAIIESYNQFMKTKSNHFTFEYDGENYLATYQSLFSSTTHPWFLGMVVPESKFVSELLKVHYIAMGIAFALFILGIIAISTVITRIVKPLRKISVEIEKMKNFDLDKTKHIDSRIKEIHYISNELDSMRQSLRSFQKYVPAALVRQLIETGEDARVGGVKKSLAILFCDIRDFTTIAERIDPDLLTKQVCEYFDELSHIIVHHRGTIDKYIGDSIMAFWGAPSPVIDPSLHACIAALDCIKKSKELNNLWQSQNKPIFVSRIGIHLGDAIVGNLGSSERLNYTAIGDAINFSSRLVNINKIYGTQIIVSETVYQAVKDWFIFRMLDIVTVKGRSESNTIFELIAKDDTIKFNIATYNQTFAKGFAAYQNAKWQEAIDDFKGCLAIYPEDTVAPVFIQRCEKFQKNPPNHWNGVWVLGEK